MAITSSSTLAEVKAQYNDNLDWDGNPTKATLALAAIRWLLVNRPARFAIGGRQTDFTVLEAEKKMLEDYLQVSGGIVNRVSFTRGVMNT